VVIHRAATEMLHQARMKYTELREQYLAEEQHGVFDDLQRLRARVTRIERALAPFAAMDEDGPIPPPPTPELYRMAREALTRQGRELLHLLDSAAGAVLATPIDEREDRRSLLQRAAKRVQVLAGSRERPRRRERGLLHHLLRQHQMRVPRVPAVRVVSALARSW